MSDPTKKLEVEDLIGMNKEDAAKHFKFFEHYSIEYRNFDDLAEALGLKDGWSADEKKRIFFAIWIGRMIERSQAKLQGESLLKRFGVDFSNLGGGAS